MHIPVLLNETIESLAVKPGGKYVDGTLGRAGHTKEILKRGGEVLGIDRDEQALKEVGEMGLKGLRTVHGMHGDLGDLAVKEGFGEVDGILLDLGVSSPQLDEAARGFSFRADGPLDMRMDRSCGMTAADLIEGSDVGQLTKVLRDLGEEPAAHRIAKAIAGRRFGTTLQLADEVERIVGRHGAHHPATRTFQALRMAVNDEIGDLERALEGGLAVLKPGGRFSIITFESLTDRIVKRFFAAHAGRMVSLQQGGERWEGELPKVRLVTRHPVTAGEEELNVNPRSRSAKLRSVERV